jgi:hypothetical protein
VTREVEGIDKHPIKPQAVGSLQMRTPVGHGPSEEGKKVIEARSWHPPSHCPILPRALSEKNIDSSLPLSTMAVKISGSVLVCRFSGFLFRLFFDLDKNDKGEKSHDSSKKVYLETKKNLQTGR